MTHSPLSSVEASEAPPLEREVREIFDQADALGMKRPDGKRAEEIARQNLDCAPKPCKHATADAPVCFACTRDRAYVRYEKRVPGADYGVIPLSWKAPEVCRG